MIIDPWGVIVACLPEGEGVTVADIGLNLMQQVREDLPALKHRRL
jgi:nitrilase